MPNRSTLEKELALVTNLRPLTAAYEEIAVMRIQNIRRQVLATRAFREGLTNVYVNVRASRYQEIARLQRRKEHIQQDVTILLSANRPLTGELPHAIFKQFLEVLGRRPTDIVIVGRTGKGVFTRLRPTENFTYFDLEYEHVTLEALRPLLAHILPYQNITIVYGKFINLVTQLPTDVLIGSEPELPQKVAALPQKKQTSAFLFEPSLKEVVDFFETQISALVVQQTANETFLAQLGSQITAMESASQRLEVYQTQLLFEQHKQQRQRRNQKQRQLLPGLFLWKTW